MTKLNPVITKYANEFRYWKDTANTFFDIAEAQIEEALKSGEGDETIIEAIADAWHKCLTAEWTLFKSGKQTCNRMALRRGVDVRQFHPAQLEKKTSKKLAGNIDDAVDKALEGK